jgi:RNA polymerase sigma factor for flagellar operon FliA
MNALPVRLTIDEAWQQWHSIKDPLAREWLVVHYASLIKYVAGRIGAGLPKRVDTNDLVSAGMFGLMRAAELYEMERGLAFATFATTRIRGAMLDELRRLDRLPRSLRAKDRQLQMVRNSLAHRLGRNPESREVAAAAGVDLPTFWRWEEEMQSSAVLTLDGRSDDDETHEESSLRERLPSPEFDLDVEMDREIERERLHEAMEQLSPDERLVLSLSFFEDKTLQEIAPQIGVTESGASRIRARALRTLRTSLEHRISRTAA